MCLGRCTHLLQTFTLDRVKPIIFISILNLIGASTIQKFYITGSYDSRFEKVLAGARAGAHTPAINLYSK